MLARLRGKNQITLPPEAVKSAHAEQGDYFEVESTTEGILLRPKKLIDASQAWFWTPEWQAGEREVDEEAARGESTFYASDEEFLAALEAGFDDK